MRSRLCVLAIWALPAIVIAQGVQSGAGSSATVTATTTGGTSLDCTANATGTCVKVSGAAGHQSVSDGTNYIRINSAGNGAVVINTGNGGSVNPYVDNQVDNGVASSAWKISRSYAYNSPATSGVQFACTGAAACQMNSASGQALTLDTGGGTGAVNLGTVNATSVLIGRSGQTTTLAGTVNATGASVNALQYSLNSGAFVLNAGAGLQMTPGQNTAAGPTFYLYPLTTVTSGNLFQLAASNTGSPIVAQVDFAGNVNIASGAAYKINNVALPTSADWNFTASIAAGLASGALITRTTAVNASTYHNATLVSSTVGVGGGNYVWKLCSDGFTCAAGNTYTTCTAACTAAANTITTCTAGAATAVAAAGSIAWSLTTACTSNPVGQASAQLTTP